MNRKSILTRLSGLLCVLSLALPAQALQIPSGSVYCFTPADFAQAEDLAGICITSVPDTGTVKLGHRILRPGDILARAQLDQISFATNTSESDTQAMFTYLPIYEDRVESTAVMSIDVLGKRDLAPVAEDSALETYKNLPNEALLKVKDPEGQPLTFTVTRQSKRGDVVIREDGSFHYTPKKNKVGVDSFTYTATDPAGNVSREATVTVTILKPSDATQYTDTVGKDCRFAAEWMKNTGIFVGESVGGNSCFGPDKQVSCGEFLTMAVGALEIPLEKTSTATADDAPLWLQPYLSAALRSGLTAGLPETFQADAPITGAQAALMLQNILDLQLPEDLETAAQLQTATPDWVDTALLALSSHGINLDADRVLTREDAACILYTATQLVPEAPGLLMLRTVI